MPVKSNSDKLMLVLVGFPECGNIRLYLDGFLIREYDVSVYGIPFLI